MTIFIPSDLDIGDSIAMEFMPPYSGRPVTMQGVVRNCHIYSYGIESRYPRPRRLRRTAKPMSARSIALDTCGHKPSYHSGQ